MLNVGQSLQIKNLKLGGQFHRFHISSLSLQELTTMDIFDMVPQWSCGLTGEWAQLGCYYHVKVMTSMGNSGGSVL